jgi:hypothetical protein
MVLLDLRMHRTGVDDLLAFGWNCGRRVSVRVVVVHLVLVLMQEFLLAMLGTEILRAAAVLGLPWCGLVHFHPANRIGSHMAPVNAFPFHF